MHALPPLHAPWARLRLQMCNLQSYCTYSLCFCKGLRLPRLNRRRRDTLKRLLLAPAFASRHNKTPLQAERPHLGTSGINSFRRQLIITNQTVSGSPTWLGRDGAFTASNRVKCPTNTVSRSTQSPRRLGPSSVDPSAICLSGPRTRLCGPVQSFQLVYTGLLVRYGPSCS